MPIPYDPFVRTLATMVLVAATLSACSAEQSVTQGSMSVTLVSAPDAASEKACRAVAETKREAAQDVDGWVMQSNRLMCRFDADGAFVSAWHPARKDEATHRVVFESSGTQFGAIL